MSATLAGCMKDILQKVENVSGKPIKFVEKRGMVMPVIAKVAVRDMDAHLFYLDRIQDELTYHAIAHECVHILRLFETKPENRLVPMASTQMRHQAFEEMEDDLQQLENSTSVENLNNMKSLWYDSIIRQVSNYPADIRVEKWLFRYYPELRPLQIRTIRKQADAAAGALKPEVCALTPKKIYDCSNAMNYAYLHLQGSLFETELIAPFRGSEYEKEGKKLAAITRDHAQDNHEGDVALIQLWADFLGISGWFAWTNIENMPAKK